MDAMPSTPVVALSESGFRNFPVGAPCSIRASATGSSEIASYTSIWTVLLTWMRVHPEAKANAAAEPTIANMCARRMRTR